MTLNDWIDFGLTAGSFLFLLALVALVEELIHRWRKRRERYYPPTWTRKRGTKS